MRPKLSDDYERIAYAILGAAGVSPVIDPSDNRIWWDKTLTRTAYLSHGEAAAVRVAHDLAMRESQADIWDVQRMNAAARAMFRAWLDGLE